MLGYQHFLQCELIWTVSQNFTLSVSLFLKCLKREDNTGYIANKQKKVW